MAPSETSIEPVVREMLRRHPTLRIHDKGPAWARVSAGELDASGLLTLGRTARAPFQRAMSDGSMMIGLTLDAIEEGVSHETR